jgi:hypothetical protein
VIIQYNKFVNNYCTANGGAYYSYTGTGTTFINNLVQNNQAGASGGGGYFDLQMTVTSMRGDVYTENTAGINGGGICIGNSNNLTSFVNVRWVSTS